VSNTTDAESSNQAGYIIINLI